MSGDGEGGCEGNQEGAEEGAEQGQEELQREAAEEVPAGQCQGGVESDEGDDGEAFIRLWRSQDFTNELNQHFNRFDSLHTIRSKLANMWKVHNKAFFLAGGCKQKVKYANVFFFFLQIRSEFGHESPPDGRGGL